MNHYDELLEISENKRFIETHSVMYIYKEGEYFNEGKITREKYNELCAKRKELDDLIHEIIKSACKCF